MNMGEFLGIEPLFLDFPFELEKRSSCVLHLSNITDCYVAFMIKTTKPKNYCVCRNSGVLLPRSRCRIIVTKQAQKEASQSIKRADKFLVQSIKVETGVTANDITPQMFIKEEGRVVEECELRVRYEALPQLPFPVPEDSHRESSTKDSASENGNDLQFQSQSLEHEDYWFLALLHIAPDGPESMEETASAVLTQPVDEPISAKVTWIIKSFSRLNTKELYSDIFIVGGYEWRISIFPKGKLWYSNNLNQFSLFVDVEDSKAVPNGWSKYAQVSISVINQVNQKFTIRKETQHQFNARDWNGGFYSFMPIGEVYDIEMGFLVNDILIVQVGVAVPRVIDYLFNDSKKSTSYVGLKNQGANIYLNSLLQILYHIPYLRKSIYHIPTTENDTPTESIPLALQSLFYKLQYSTTSVSTKKLIKSFGWDTFDFFTQNHVQELNRILYEKLEAVMKATVVEGTIQQLFIGHQTNYIEFIDLMLDVRGCRDVYASFDKYLGAESVKDDDKNHPEQHGFQDTKKGLLFNNFPPVLQLQLKRFEYDFMGDTIVKINDRYEYPFQLDLDRENGKYLAPEADRSVRNLYTLYSVLVHSADVHGGHYCSYVRPMLSRQWFKFDNEHVTKVDRRTVLDDQYGGEEGLPQANPGLSNSSFKFTKYSNACMLVYIRENDKEKIMCSVDEQDIAEHLRIRLKKEQEEEELKGKQMTEAHLHTIIKVARNEDLHKQIGKDKFFDLVDHEKVQSFGIQMNIPFFAFKEALARELGVPPQCQRFWVWAKRQNHTYRPYRPLTLQEEAQPVSQLKEVSYIDNTAELKLFLEVQFGKGSLPIPPGEKTKDDILLFFKLYNPVKEHLRYVGCLFVKATEKPKDIITKINEMAGFSPDQEIELYEEIQFEPSVICKHIDKNLQFCSSQLDGDIICIQKYPRSDEQFRYPDVQSFLEYVHNRQVLRFRSLKNHKDDEFSLELSKLHNYDDVVERVACRLGLDDPSKVCLYSHNCHSQQPKPQSIKYRGFDHLSDMLVHYNQTSDILYYEILDIPLPKFQGVKTLISFHHASKDEVVIHSIKLPKQSTVGDLLADLKTKVELSNPNAELRLLEVFYHKIYKVFHHSEKIEKINDQDWTSHAEEIPEEEKNLGPHYILIQFYFSLEGILQNQSHNIGKPFLFAICKGERVLEVKLRLQRKFFGVEFKKWKLFTSSAGRRIYLHNSDILSNHFEKINYDAPIVVIEADSVSKISACRKICVAREGSHVEWIFLHNDEPMVETDLAQPPNTSDNGSGSVVVSNGPKSFFKYFKRSGKH